MVPLDGGVCFVGCTNSVKAGGKYVKINHRISEGSIGYEARWAGGLDT